ncbi:MAG: tryptophan synthase subunit alpha [Planctomycetota bacterium]
MNRLRNVFAQLLTNTRRGLLPYITAGYPDIDTTIAILKRLDTRQCACVELGIPYSDSIADGPVIQTSFTRALAAGFRLDNLITALTRHRNQIRVPLIAMVSYSIVYRRDPARFVRTAQAAGIDGLIVPDLVIEEADELVTVAREHDCPLIMMIAPTTTPDRSQRIAAISEPFIYYQSITGVTGERNTLPADLSVRIKQLQQDHGKPVCVGFGISQPEQVAAVCQVADGAIVGSAIVRCMNAAVEDNAAPEQIAEAVSTLITHLASKLPN